MVVSRVIDPCPKLATCRALIDETKFTTLGEVLNLGKVNEEELYQAMDWQIARLGWIEEKLAKFGHDRDGKTRFPPILWGVLCNGEGCPIAVEVSEGNIADPESLSSQMRKACERFGLEWVVMGGDRGIINEAPIREELSSVDGLDWISSRNKSDSGFCLYGRWAFSTLDSSLKCS